MFVHLEIMSTKINTQKSVKLENKLLKLENRLFTSRMHRIIAMGR